MTNQEEFYARQIKQQDELYARLLKRVENTEGYQHKDIKLIEHECTRAVYSWLKKLPNTKIIKKEEHFISTLNDPFTNDKITELDGAIIIKNSVTNQKVLIIVECKHDVVKREILDKEEQIPKIQKWIDQEKKYYNICWEYDTVKNKHKQVKNSLKLLRRQQRRGNISNDNIINKKQEESCRLDSEENLLESELDDIVEKNNWHPKFVKTLQNLDLRFDKFVLFFGAPVWEKESYKLDLLKKNIGIIELSGNRYQVKPERVVI